MEQDTHNGATAYIRENLDLQVLTGRDSTGFVQGLAYLFESRSGNVFAIFDELAVTEGAPAPVQASRNLALRCAAAPDRALARALSPSLVPAPENLEPPARE
jgi:hypothetical protein